MGVRIKVILENSRPLKLHIDTGYYLRSVFYEALRGTGLDEYLHNAYSVKPFSVSNLLGSSPRIIDGNTIVFENNVHFYVSSIYDEIINTFMSNILEKGYVQIADYRLPIRRIYTIPEPEYTKKFYLKTISPVVLFKKDENLWLTNPLFISKFNDLINRRLEYYGGSIDALDIVEVKEKPIKFKTDEGFTRVIRSYLMRLEVIGDREAMDTLYHTGVGQYTTRGLGFTFVDENKPARRQTFEKERKNVVIRPFQQAS